MLRHGGDVFLDDVTLADVSGELGVPVRVVGSDGADLIRAMLGF
jgi:NifB/MoaA-like Fe-S oxidoreductase